MSRLGLKSATAVAVLVLAAVTLTASPVQAAPTNRVIPLPGATSAEGIAGGAGSTFYAGDLFSGDIFRGDLQRGTVEKFIDNPPGRGALGLRVDQANKLLFVAGGFDGRAFVYDLTTGATVKTYQFSTADSVINDVAVTRGGAWFTNSRQSVLYFVPVVHGVPGPFRVLPLTGPAADTTGTFNNNGIQATADGRTLLVAHSAQGTINRVDTATGRSVTVAGVSVPNVDGILLQGRTLYAVQNFDNRIAQVKLSGDLRTGSVTKVITSPSFAIPTTVMRFGDRLATVNSHFDTGIPPTSATYEVVVVRR